MSRCRPRGAGTTMRVLLFAAASLTSSCGREPATDSGLTPVYDQNTGKLQELKYDSNGDGIVDSVCFMDGGRLLRIEIDKDQDGRVERWEYYRGERELEKVGISRANDGKPDAWSYPAEAGQLTRVEVSSARNGTVDRVEHYDGDVLVRAEADTNGDGRMDRWETFADGRLSSLAFDTTFRGSPDRRLTYRPDGEVVAEVDADGDGRFTIEAHQ